MIADKWSLDGKVAIVTGGGTGIGHAISLALAGAGADVAIAGLSVTQEEMSRTSAEIAELGRHPLVIPADIADSAQAEAMVARCVEEMGKADILINNAGIMEREPRPIWEMSDDDWQKIVNVNLTGTFFCCRAAAKHMREQGGGNIVNIASVAGMRGLKNMYGYCASKAGVIGLTQSLAVSLAESKIRVNAIAPAFIATWRDREAYDAVARFVPVGHVGTPEDIAPLAVYLCSDASSYVHGQLFCIDGGSSAGGYAPTGYVPTITEGQ